jgi:hypothetical protein
VRSRSELVAENAPIERMARENRLRDLPGVHPAGLTRESSGSVPLQRSLGRRAHPGRAAAAEGDAGGNGAAVPDPRPRRQVRLRVRSCRGGHRHRGDPDAHPSAARQRRMRALPRQRPARVSGSHPDPGRAPPSARPGEVRRPLQRGRPHRGIDQRTPTSLGVATPRPPSDAAHAVTGVPSWAGSTTSTAAPPDEAGWPE